jgi:hypothetical protein
VNYINDRLADKGIKVKPLNDAWELVSLSPDENWGERYVTSRAVRQIGGEFLSLKWFIDNLLLGEMAEVFSKVMQGKLPLPSDKLPSVDH